MNKIIWNLVSVMSCNRKLVHVLRLFKSFRFKIDFDNAWSKLY